MAILPIRCNVRNTPAGNIVATNIQDAINELDNEKVAKAGDTMTGNLLMTSSYIGINNATPTAFLSIGPNTAYAPQIRLDGGSQFTSSPVSGAIEYVNGRFYITSANRRVIDRSSNTVTSSIIVTGTSAEQCLFSGSFTSR